MGVYDVVETWDRLETLYMNGSIATELLRVWSILLWPGVNVPSHYLQKGSETRGVGCGCYGCNVSLEIDDICVVHDMNPFGEELSNEKQCDMRCFSHCRTTRENVMDILPMMTGAVVSRETFRQLNQYYYY